MKLVFGLIGAVLMVVFLGSVAIKVRELSMFIVMGIGIVMVVIDLWQARNEEDT